MKSFVCALTFLGFSLFAHAEELKVIYQVPVEEEALFDYAKYEMLYTEFSEGSEKLYITLPQELVGKEDLDFQLKKMDTDVPDFALFTDGENLAVCKKMKCAISLQPGLVDFAAVEAQLVSRGASDIERAARLRVSAIFDRDPIGVIHFGDSTEIHGD